MKFLAYWFIGLFTLPGFIIGMIYRGFYVGFSVSKDVLDWICEDE